MKIFLLFSVIFSLLFSSCKNDDSTNSSNISNSYLGDYHITFALYDNVGALGDGYLHVDKDGKFQGTMTFIDHSGRSLNGTVDASGHIANGEIKNKGLLEGNMSGYLGNIAGWASLNKYSMLYGGHNTGGAWVAKTNK